MIRYTYQPKVITEDAIKRFRPTRLIVKELAGILYFCKSTVDDIERYPGSGKIWKDRIKKYGKENINTLLVSDWYYCPHEVQKDALKFSEENHIVESKKWANAKPEDGLDGGNTGVYPNKGKFGKDSRNFGKKYNMTDTGTQSKRESGKRMVEKNFGDKTPEYWQQHYANTLGKLTKEERHLIAIKKENKGGEKWSKASSNQVTVTDLLGNSKRIKRDLFWSMKNDMIEHNIPVEQWQYVQVSSLESKKRRMKNGNS
jgi:hypothetical protein